MFFLSANFLIFLFSDFLFYLNLEPTLSRTKNSLSCRCVILDIVWNKIIRCYRVFFFFKQGKNQFFKRPSSWTRKLKRPVQIHIFLHGIHFQECNRIPESISLRKKPTRLSVHRKSDFPLNTFQ